MNPATDSRSSRAARFRHRTHHFLRDGHVYITADDALSVAVNLWVIATDNALSPVLLHTRSTRAVRCEGAICSAILNARDTDQTSYLRRDVHDEAV